MFTFRVPSKATCTTSLRLTEDEIKLFREFAKNQGVTVSDVIRKTVMKEIANTTDFKTDFVSN